MRLLILDRFGFIGLDTGLDKFGALRILERIQCLVVGQVELTHTSEHYRYSVAAERIFQQPRQLAISVGYMRA